MANGVIQYARELINDSQIATKTTYSSDKIEKLIADGKVKVTSTPVAATTTTPAYTKIDIVVGTGSTATTTTFNIPSKYVIGAHVATDGKLILEMSDGTTINLGKIGSGSSAVYQSTKTLINKVNQQTILTTANLIETVTLTDDIDLNQLVYDAKGTIARVTSIDLANNQFVVTTMTLEDEYMSQAPNTKEFRIINGGSNYQVGDVIESTTTGIFADITGVDTNGSITSVTLSTATAQSVSGAGATIDYDQIVYGAYGNTWTALSNAAVLVAQIITEQFEYIDGYKIEITGAGTGYSVNDIVEVSSGVFARVLTVGTSGEILTLEYSRETVQNTSGTGATFNVTTDPNTFIIPSIYWNSTSDIFNLVNDDGASVLFNRAGDVTTKYSAGPDGKTYKFVYNQYNGTITQSYKISGGGGLSTISSKAGNAATNITGSTNPTEDGLYVEDLSTIVNSISLSQKTVNSDLDYCFVGFWNNTNSEVYATCTRGAAIPFNTKFEGNLDFNLTNKAIKLKAGHRYKLHYQCKQTDTTANGNHMERFYNETTSEWLKMACNCDTPDETHTMEEIYVPTVDCEVSVRNCWSPLTSFSMRVNCINTDATGPGLRKIDCESAFIVTEIGKTVTVDPVAYLSKDGNLEETPVGSIISYIGTNAPAHYLLCDGSIYNIVDYPELALHIKNEFGTYNYFGGDGVTTFAVPNSFSWWQPTLVNGLIPRPYSVSVSSSYNTTQYQKELMFDGVISRDSCWHSAADGSDTDIWVKFDFGKNTGINGLRMAARHTSYLNQLPSTFTIEGSYDDVTYTVIKSYSGLPNPASTAFREHIFDKPVNYRYYKLNHITSNAKNGGYDYCSIAELEFSKVDNIQCIKYETTHKVFFGDQTTYKVSVPFNLTTLVHKFARWTLDSANAIDDVSLINGNDLVAPMDGYYLISASSGFISDGAQDIEFFQQDWYVNNVQVSSNRQYTGSSRDTTSTLGGNVLFRRLNKGDKVQLGIYQGGHSLQISGTVTMSLVNTLNENKVLELMNKPNLWVAGQEYDFGDGVYGVKLTLTNNSSTDSIIDLSKYNVSEIEKVEGKAVVDNGYAQALIPCCYSTSAFLSCWFEISSKLLHLFRGTQYSQSTDRFEINIWYKK